MRFFNCFSGSMFGYIYTAQKLDRIAVKVEKDAF